MKNTLLFFLTSFLSITLYAADFNLCKNESGAYPFTSRSQKYDSLTKSINDRLQSKLVLSSVDIHMASMAIVYSNHIANIYNQASYMLIMHNSLRDDNLNIRKSTADFISQGFEAIKSTRSTLKFYIESVRDKQLQRDFIDFRIEIEKDIENYKSCI